MTPTIIAARVLLLVAITGTGFSESVTAAELSYGEWRVSTDDNFHEAFTANSSGSTLGVLCVIEKESCVYYLRSDTSCKEGSQTPILLNSSRGSSDALLHCTSLSVASDKQNEFINIFANSSLILKILNSSGILGIAMPLADGEFKVMRFSLQGRTAQLKLLVLCRPLTLK